MSIVDPLGKRTMGSGKPLPTPFEAHLRGPENYDTPRSRDIFNVAHRLEAGRPVRTPKKPSLGHRLLQTFGLSKPTESPQPDRRIMAIGASQSRHLGRDYQQQTNPVHRRLPEEHLEAWHRAAEERKRTSSQRNPRGPVPRRPQLPDTVHLSHSLTTAFLTPLELEIYNTMRRVGRCATFTPFTSSRAEDNRQQIMLVHPSNESALQDLQTLACSLSDQEKHAVLRSLQGLLIPTLLGPLQTILFQLDVRITSTSCSGRGYSPDENKERKRLRRPESWEIFAGRINPSWEHVASPNAKGYVLYDRDRGYDDDHHQREDSLFKSFSQKEFMPDQSSASSSSSSSSSKNSSFTNNNNVRLHLRGGGDSDDTTFPFQRTTQTYLSHFIRPTPPHPLPDEERVPRALFWLAGGRVSSRKKAPTAGEMRARRRREAENRVAVGFVGTLFGVRRRKGTAPPPVPTGSEARLETSSEAGVVVDAKGKGVAKDSDEEGGDAA